MKYTTTLPTLCTQRTLYRCTLSCTYICFYHTCTVMNITVYILHCTEQGCFDKYTCCRTERLLWDATSLTRKSSVSTSRSTQALKLQQSVKSCAHWMQHAKNLCITQKVTPKISAFIRKCQLMKSSSDYEAETGIIVGPKKC